MMDEWLRTIVYAWGWLAFAVTGLAAAVYIVERMLGWLKQKQN